MELNSSARPIGFLGLPVEIRRLIYQYCLVRKDPFDFPDRLINLERLSQCRVRDLKNSLLLVSKKVGAEALEVLYDDNTFEIHIHYGEGCHFTGPFWEANRRRIRKLQIVTRPYYGYDYSGRTSDSTPWSPLLAQLKKLTIVAQHPLQLRVGQHYTAEETKKWMEQQWMEQQWMEQLTESLRCYSSGLRSSCVVEVDDNDLTETDTLIRECFPRGYRKVQTLAGNLLFQGPRYYTGSDYCSGGSDYWNQTIPTWFGERHPPCVTGPTLLYQSTNRHFRFVLRALEHSFSGS